MTQSMNFRHVVLLVSTIFILISGTVCWADESNPIPRILVTGQGSVDIAPDMAVKEADEDAKFSIPLDISPNIVLKFVTTSFSECIKVPISSFCL